MDGSRTCPWSGWPNVRVSLRFAPELLHLSSNTVGDLVLLQGPLYPVVWPKTPQSQQLIEEFIGT